MVNRVSSSFQKGGHSANKLRKINSETCTSGTLNWYGYIYFNFNTDIYFFKTRVKVILSNTMPYDRNSSSHVYKNEIFTK